MTTNNQEWEKEFFERFGANKIWVTPSRENVETILEIWSFIHSLLSHHQSSLVEGVREKINKAHVEFQERPTREDVGLMTFVPKSSPSSPPATSSSSLPPFSTTPLTLSISRGRWGGGDLNLTLS